MRSFFYLNGNVKDFIKAHPEFRLDESMKPFEIYRYKVPGVRYGINLSRIKKQMRLRFSYINPISSVMIAKLIELGKEGWIDISPIYEDEPPKFRSHTLTDEEWKYIQDLRKAKNNESESD